MKTRMHGRKGERRWPLLLLLPLPMLLVAQQAAQHPGTDAVAVGIRALRTGDTVAALRSFEFATHQQPRSADAWTWQGIAQGRLSNFAEAVVSLRRAVMLNPASVPAHYNLALDLIRLQKPDEAIAELRRVVALQPAQVDPHFNLAVLLDGAGQTEESAAEFAAAHTLAPADTRITLRLLGELGKAGNANDVSALAEQIRNAGDATTVAQAVETLLQVKLFADAATIAEALPANWPARTQLLARALIGQQAYPRALALVQADPSTPRDAGLSYLAGLAALGAGQRDMAAQSFQAAAAVDPTLPGAHFHLGLLADEAGSAADAATELATANRLDPANPDGALAYARVLLQTNNTARIAPVLLAARSLSPQQERERHLLQGIVALSAGSAAAAAPDLQDAAKAGDSPLADNLLGFCLFSKGDYAGAAAHDRKASDALPQQRTFARDTAVALLRADDAAAALPYASRAAALPGAGAADFVLKGKLEARTGQKQSAIEDLLHASTLDPDNDAALYLLARTYLQMGDREQATAWNAKLTAVKARKAEQYAQNKTGSPTATTAASLLTGGNLPDTDAGAR